MMFWFLTLIAIQQCFGEIITASQGQNPTCSGTGPCFIHCKNQNCQNAFINCPLFQDCFINCYDPSSCAGARVNCPENGKKCDISCQDSNSCSGTNLNCAWNTQCNIELHCNPGNNRGGNQKTVSNACANFAIAWATDKNAYECIGGELNDKNACPKVGSPPGKEVAAVCITKDDCSNHYSMPECSGGRCYCHSKGKCCRRYFPSGQGSYTRCFFNDPQYAYTISEDTMDSTTDNSTRTVVCVIIASAVLLAIVAGVCVYFRRRKRNKMMANLDLVESEEEDEEIVVQEVEVEVETETTGMTN